MCVIKGVKINLKGTLKILKMLHLRSDLIGSNITDIRARGPSLETEFRLISQESVGLLHSYLKMTTQRRGLV